MRAFVAAVGLVLLFGGAGCTLESAAEDRAASIERRLLASCICHPRKISGLPLESRIRQAIETGIASGLDDDAILWQVLMAHGNAILRAGTDDLEYQAVAFAVESAGILAAGLAVLLLQLRRRPGPD